MSNLTKMRLLKNVLIHPLIKCIAILFIFQNCAFSNPVSFYKKPVLFNFTNAS